MNLNSIKGYKIAVNHAYKYVDADMTVFLDNIQEFIDNAPNPQYLKCFGGQWVQKGQTLITEKGFVPTYSQTIFAALAIAIQMGFKEIHIYGWDNEIDDYVHFYDDKPVGPERPHYERQFAMAERICNENAPALKGYSIYLYDSSIKCFKNKPLW